MTPKLGASPLADFREAVGKLRLIADASAVALQHLDEASADTHAAYAAARRLQAELIARLDRVEATYRWEKTPPRGGRPKAQIREETRRKVRVMLARNPKVRWRAVRDATGLSEHLAKRVLREESGRKPNQQTGENRSHFRGES